MLSKELNRIKNIMRIISEQEVKDYFDIETDEDYINFLQKNGFKTPTQQEASSFFSPAKFTMNKYEWVMINPLTKVYSYKSNDNDTITLGRKSIFSPKEDKTYNGYFVSVTLPPKDYHIKEFITEPVIIDETYDLNSLITMINNIRDVWGPGLIKIESGSYKFNNKDMNPAVVKSISNGIKLNLTKVKNLINKLPEDIVNKGVKDKNGESYPNIKYYLNKTETEAKNLKLLS